MKKQQGTVLFSNVVSFPTFNGTPTDKYEVTIQLNEEQRADGEVQGLTIKTKMYQEQEQCLAKLKTKFKLKASHFVDRDKQPFIDDTGSIREIPRGSEVVVFYTQRTVKTPSGTMVTTNDLQGIQVVTEQVGVQFDDYDSGFTATETDESDEDIPF